MKFWDAARFQWLTGIIDILGDLDKYVTYILLVNAVGCDHWSDASGLYYIAYAIMAIVAQPLSGYVADNCGNQLHRVLLAFQVVVLLGMVGMMLISHSFLALGALYIIRWTAGILAFTCTWKIIKVRVEMECGDDFLEQQARMNRIGTVGDLGGQVIEIMIMGAVFGVAYFTEDPSYTVVKILLFGSFIGLQVSVVLVTATFTSRYVTGADLPLVDEGITDSSTDTASSTKIESSPSLDAAALARSTSAPSAVSDNGYSGLPHSDVDESHRTNTVATRSSAITTSASPAGSPILKPSSAPSGHGSMLASGGSNEAPNTPGTPSTPLPGLVDGVYLHSSNTKQAAQAPRRVSDARNGFTDRIGRPQIRVHVEPAHSNGDAQTVTANGSTLAAKVWTADSSGARATTSIDGNGASHRHLRSPYSTGSSDGSAKSGNSEADELKVSDQG